MSAEDGGDGGSPGRREVAYRVFAAEFDDADVSYSESDEERAPNYVITPTGGRVNRVFAVGVLTEVQPAGEEILRARIADPTGTFVVYAGQYQPDAQTFLERAEPPAYVAVTGKARTFQPEDSDVVYTSIRPESLNEVEAATRDRWTVGAARQTLERVGAMATAMTLDADGEELTEALRDRGVAEGLAAGIPLALDHYGTTPGYLAAVRETALSAAGIVAGEREEAEPLALAPDQGGEADLNVLAATADLAEPTATAGDEGAAAVPSDDDTTTGGTASDPGSTSDPETTDPVTTESDTGVDSEPEPDTDAATPTEGVTDDTAEAVDEDDASTAEGESDEGTDEATGTDAESADLGEFDGEFELDDEEREEIKSEFGTEFASGTEVEEPGAADIETPDPDAEAVDAASTETATGPDAAPEPADTAEESTGDDAEAEEGTAPDLDDAVMAAMADLDDGDGADRAAVIERVSDDQDVPADAVEDAIQEALMDGRCYEPGEGQLKPI